MLIQRLARLMSRRSPPKAPSAVLLTWESELRAIAAEASAWSIETGGDLFGRWNDVPDHPACDESRAERRSAITLTFVWMSNTCASSARLLRPTGLSGISEIGIPITD